MGEVRGLAGSRILVTGGAGFIGSNFVHYLFSHVPDVQVVVLDALTYAGRRENLDGLPSDRFSFIKGDITEPENVDDAIKGCDYILNFAAESHVDRSIERPGQFLLTDVYGVFVLCEVAKRQQAFRRFIQISTDEVYGEVLEGSAAEDAPLMPRSPYAASKAGGDRLAYAYRTTYGLPVVITRCSNNYGPRQYPEKLIPLFVTNAIDDQALPVYGTGLNRRDWIHVDDHCEALLRLLVTPGIDGEIFNIGSGEELDVLSITRLILDVLGKSTSLVTHVEDRPGHDRRYALDCEKIRRATGWAPTVSLNEGLRKAVEWYRTNESWWRPIKQGEFRQYYERMYGKRKVLKEARA